MARTTKKFKQSTGPHMSKPPPLEPKQRVCSLCGVPSFGTLVKDNGGYRHQNRRFCEGAKREKQQRKADEYVKKLKTEEKDEQSPTTR